MAGAGSSGLSLPLVVVSANQQIAPIFARFRLPLLSQLEPDADDAAWEYALGRLLDYHARRDPERPANNNLPAVGLHIGEGEQGLALRGGVHLDLDGWRLRTSNGDISLTPRERAVLQFLARTPGRWHSRTTLADTLSSDAATPVFEHSIEQTISGLRRKLREQGLTLEFLRSQRGRGYVLLVEEPAFVRA